MIEFVSVAQNGVTSEVLCVVQFTSFFIFIYISRLPAHLLSASVVYVFHSITFHSIGRVISFASFLAKAPSRGTAFPPWRQPLMNVTSYVAHYITYTRNDFPRRRHLSPTAFSNEKAWTVRTSGDQTAIDMKSIHTKKNAVATTNCIAASRDEKPIGFCCWQTSLKLRSFLLLLVFRNSFERCSFAILNTCAVLNHWL